MKPKLPMVIWLSMLIILGACSPKKEEPVAETKVRPVRVETIAGRDIPIMVNAVGRLTPDREVVLSAEVPGILMKYAADVGSKVAKSTSLVKLDPADYALALKEAEATLLAARINLPVAQNAFERAQRLLPDKVITPELYDQAEASYASAKTRVTRLESLVDMARRRLEKTTIHPPFAGYVTQRFVETGQNVAVGDPLMKIADMQTMRVHIYINELDYVHVDKDDPVTVTVEAYPDQPITGRVDKIGIQADARTNTFEIEILVDNTDFRLKAGLTARVAVQTDTIPDAVMIAQNCVLFRENRQEVFLLDDDQRAQAREIELGRMDGSDVHILHGLAPGEVLVISGAQYLKPGEKVVVAP